MTEEFTPSVENEIAEGPSLEEQAAELGITDEEGVPYGDPAPETEGQEELILGKFESQDQLEQAYTQLEQHMGQNPGMAQPLTQASEYFSQYGQLAEEHYAALDAAGLNRGLVDSYIAGAYAQQQTTGQDHFATVGGEENYQAMSGWMTQYLPQNEIDAYNRVMQQGTDDEIGVLMSGMYSRYQSAYSQHYEQLQGEGSTEGLPGYESRGQVMAALNDPRYETDAAYREDFEEKLALTPEDIF